jgi:hypothetical protein
MVAAAGDKLQAWLSWVLLLLSVDIFSLTSDSAVQSHPFAATLLQQAD